MQTLESLSFLLKKSVKFRNLQIIKILNTDTNIICPIHFKVMYIPLSYSWFEKQFHSLLPLFWIEVWCLQNQCIFI